MEFGVERLDTSHSLLKQRFHFIRSAIIQSFCSVSTLLYWCALFSLCFRDVKRVLFVPYALHDRDTYTKTARDKFKTLGECVCVWVYERERERELMMCCVLMCTILYVYKVYIIIMQCGQICVCIPMYVYADIHATPWLLMSFLCYVGLITGVVMMWQSITHTHAHTSTPTNKYRV